MQSKDGVKVLTARSTAFDAAAVGSNEVNP